MDVYGGSVVIKNTWFYNGRVGVLRPASGHPDDFWDYNVVLDDGQIIGVMRDQFEPLF